MYCYVCLSRIYVAFATCPTFPSICARCMNERCFQTPTKRLLSEHCNDEYNWILQPNQANPNTTQRSRPNTRRRFSRQTRIQRNNHRRRRLHPRSIRLHLLQLLFQRSNLVRRSPLPPMSLEYRKRRRSCRIGSRTSMRRRRVRGGHLMRECDD